MKTQVSTASAPYAIESVGFRAIPKAEIDALSNLEAGNWRLEATEAKLRGGSPRFACLGCGAGLYPKYGPGGIADKTVGRLWAHFARADGLPNDCPYSIGRPLTWDQLDALIYQGRQEGPVHRAIVARIVEMAKATEGIEADSIKDGEYVRSKTKECMGRFPDVYFETAFGKFAFEVQLSPITLHRIVERMEFYRGEGIALIWVTSDFLPEALRRSWAWDVVASQGSRAFTVTAEHVNRARETHRFVLRMSKWNEDAKRFDDAETDLRDLAVKPWHVDVKERWKIAAGNSWRNVLEPGLVHEILEHIGVAIAKGDELREYDFAPLINALISLEAGEVIGSKHPNLRAHMDSAVETKSLRGCARLLDLAVAHYRPELLHSDKSPDPGTQSPLARKFKDFASNTPQLDRNSTVGKVRAVLFPDWELPPEKSALPRDGLS